jgi:hypothetical protein
MSYILTMSIREIVSKSTFIDLMNEIKTRYYIPASLSSKLNDIMMKINKLYNDKFLFAYRFNGNHFYIQTEELRNQLLEGLNSVLEKFDEKYEDDKLIIMSKLELYNELIYDDEVNETYHDIFFPKSTLEVLSRKSDEKYEIGVWTEIKPKVDMSLAGSFSQSEKSSQNTKYFDAPNTTYINANYELDMLSMDAESFMKYTSMDHKFNMVCIGSDYKKKDFFDYIYEKLSTKLKFKKELLYDIFQYYEGCVPQTASHFVLAS